MRRLLRFRPVVFAVAGSFDIDMAGHKAVVAAVVEAAGMDWVGMGLAGMDWVGMDWPAAVHKAAAPVHRAAPGCKAVDCTGCILLRHRDLTRRIFHKAFLKPPDSVVKTYPKIYSFYKNILQNIPEKPSVFGIYEVPT